MPITSKLVAASTYPGIRGHAGRHTKRVVITAVALFVATGGIAYATIPDSNGVYTACVHRHGGTIRMIDPSLPSTDPNGHCRKSETQITWNQQGQPGPQGLTGKEGAPGANGKDGVSPIVAQLAPGDSHCSGGGAAITDAAGNTAHVCNGTNGKDGQPFAGTFTSPNGQFAITVADTGITLTGPTGSIKLDAGSLTLNALGATTVNAGVLSLNAKPILLNGSASCAPAARQGDPIMGSGVGAVTGTITQGSSTVCVGP